MAYNTTSYTVCKQTVMESTHVKRKTDSSSVGKYYADLGTPAAQLGDICSMFKGVSWADIMDGFSRPIDDSTTAIRSAISHEEFLFRYYTDLMTDPYLYGSDLEDEKADTEAELRDLGKWDDVLTHLVYLKDTEVSQITERAAEAVRREEAIRERALKIATSIRNAISLDKAVATRRVRLLGICKKSQQCPTQGHGCKFAHPGENDYKKALYQRIAKVIAQGLETSGKYRCRNEECVAHSFGLCLYSHSDDERAKADADNVSASQEKREAMALHLEDLRVLIEKEQTRW